MQGTDVNRLHEKKADRPAYLRILLCVYYENREISTQQIFEICPMYLKSISLILER